MPKGILPRGTIFWTVLLLVGLFLPLTFGGLGFRSDLGLFTVYASANLMWTLVLGTAGITSNGNLVRLTAGGLLTIGTGVGQGVTAAGTVIDLSAAGVRRSARMVFEGRLPSKVR